jgi:hypothetical protein
MSKKNKRQTRRSSDSVAASTAMPAVESTTRSSDRDFKPDYSYVMKDLRRIAILAGTFFAILIALSFILN